MADIVGTSLSALSAASASIRTLGAGRSVSTPQAQELPGDLRSSRFASHRPTVSAAQAGSMVALSIFIAESITSLLDHLDDSVRLAGSSTTQTAANIHVGYGTRLSVGNIQAGIDQTLDGIARLIEKADFGSANPLSSKSPDIAIQTSVYGGKVNIQPQAFDVAGLGLEGLDLRTREGRADALARVGRAQVLAGKRLLNLKALQSGLGDPSALSGALDSLRASGGNLRGALVDLSA